MRLSTLALVSYITLLLEKLVVSAFTLQRAFSVSNKVVQNSNILSESPHGAGCRCATCITHSPSCTCKMCASTTALTLSKNHSAACECGMCSSKSHPVSCLCSICSSKSHPSSCSCTVCVMKSHPSTCNCATCSS